MEIFEVLFSLFSSSKMSGELLSFECAEDPTQDPSQPVLVINGRREGFIYRLLEMLQLVETEFSVSIDADYIIVSDSPNEYQYFPTNEVHNFATSYGKKKIYLVLAVLFSFFSLFTLLASLGESELLVMFIFSAIIAVLFNYLYKKSEAMGIALQMISSDRSRTTVGIRVKGSNVEQAYLEQATKALKFVHQNYSLGTAHKSATGNQSSAVRLSKS